MARLCSTCSLLYAILSLTISVNCLNLADNYYLYKSSLSQLEDSIVDYKPLRTKRETVLPVPGVPSKTESTTFTPINIDHFINESLSTDPSHPKQLLNFGENGHGIRKNVTGVDAINATGTSTPSPTKPTLSTKTNQTNDTDDQISITEFSDAIDFNKTLKQHNIIETRNDTHIYYNSTITIDRNVANTYWIDMTNRSDVKINEFLSQSHRRAATIKLRFDFPFYGHLVRNVTIATGGFLYTGEYVHSWLAATQYIAPLMANFDTSLHEFSVIKYIDNGTAFTVQWENVSLQDRPETGLFTFQATLVNNGDIIFVYKKVPFIVENIQDDHHPVKVGLSDAYIIDRTIFFVRRKTIYEYHRVNFKKKDIKNDTVIYLKALPTCLDSTDCQTCLTTKIPNFQCTWCPTTHRCSNGLDRHRQDWFMKGCDKKQFSDESKCTQQGLDVFDYGPHGTDDQDIHLGHNHTFDDDTLHHTGEDVHDVSGRSKQTFDQGKHSFDDVMQAPRRSRDRNGETGSVSMGASGIIAILFMVVLVSGMGVWVMYAYRNPHTTSGQILIRYRPSQWRWKRGEARYTAATIHM